MMRDSTDNNLISQSSAEQASIIKQQHIQELFNKRAHNDANSVTLANTLDQLIDTALKGDNKFIYESLQNADDAAINGTSVNVSFTVTAHYLIFMHDG